MQSSFKKHFQLFVFRKFFGWSLVLSFRESICVTSASSKDLLETWLEERIGFRTCSTTSRWATFQKFPIEPTNFWIQFVRTERPVVKDDTRTVQDVRKTSLSQEIDVNSFHEETVSSERTGRPVVETSVFQTRSSEYSKDPNVETAHERTRRLVVETNTENVPDSCKTRSCHESQRFNVGDKTLRERTERPVVNRDELGHEQNKLNEVNMDFRIPGLPHSVVKHAQSTSVRELIRKIKNHPDRHALQQDLRQNQAKVQKSRKIIKDVGNVKLFELFERQCKACLSYWSEGIVYCTCGNLLKETVVNRSVIVYTLAFFQFQNT